MSRYQFLLQLIGNDFIAAGQAETLSICLVGFYKHAALCYPNKHRRNRWRIS